MTVTLLGTGTSCGVPMLGCHCAVCTSHDPHDKRTRCSALVETESTRILIDCGPDFRQQMMNRDFRRIDAILVTHSHYDHIGGIDDIRPYCVFGDIDIYANQKASVSLKQTIPYCFGKHKYPNVPEIRLKTIVPHCQLRIGDINVVPIEVMHDNLPILGYRFDNLAYITDMKTISDSELPYLMGLDTLIVNALRFTRPHHSHQLVDDAVAFAKLIGVRRTLLIHSSHHIGLHADVNSKLPDGFELAYDGQILNIR